MQIPADVKSGILSHERKELFLSNVRKQINEIRATRLRLGKRPFEDSEYIWMIESMTEMFVGASIKFYEDRAKSSAEKTRIKTEIDDVNDMESTLAGKPQGDYADIVQVVGDGDALEKLQEKEADL